MANTAGTLPANGSGALSRSGPPKTGAAEPKALLTLKDVGVTLNSSILLTDINLTIFAGEILTIIGPNGGGKTTLVRVLLGLQPPTTGTLERHGDVRVGYVPQRFERHMAMPITAGNFLALGHGTSAEDIRTALAECGASHVFETQLSQLSGGELQRVLLTRALLRKPDLLVLDEPVRGVDHMGEADLYNLIGRLRRERGFSVVLVSHDLHVVMAASDRVICLNKHICCSGKPVTVAQQPEYAHMFGKEAAAAFAVYEHHHDHAHDISGDPLPDGETSADECCGHGDHGHGPKS
ncbi:MAG: ATP-binding cassette domain-containing protein [Pseudomonadota bacterium]